MVEIRRLSDLHLQEVVPLVERSLAEGHRMVERLVADWRDGSNRFDRDGEALYGAYVGTALVGVCGRNIDPFRGDPAIGRVRHLYVLPDWRRRGVARALMVEVIGDARGRFSVLTLRTRNPEADRFYRGLGFGPPPVARDTEPHVLAL
jgi:GNAT superfamily N-acetyltransferase